MLNDTVPVCRCHAQHVPSLSTVVLVPNRMVPPIWSFEPSGMKTMAASTGGRRGERRGSARWNGKEIKGGEEIKCEPMILE